MKKILVAMAILLVVSLAMAEEIPAPFNAAKELCLKSQPTNEGLYVLQFPKKDSEGVFYILAHHPETGYTVIGMKEGREICVVRYKEETKEFSIYYDGMVIQESQEVMLEMAFNIFRSLVEQNFI